MSSPVGEDGSLTEGDSPARGDGGVLITQLSEEGDVSNSMTSDARSEGETTLHSHSIDSPIIEEEEEDTTGLGQISSKFSRKSNRSHFSQQDDNRPDGGSLTHTDTNDNRSSFPHGPGTSYIRGGEGRGQEEFNEEGEEEAGGEEGEDYEEGSYLDSMSMDNVSDTCSYEEPVEVRDEDFDTDLEMDDDKWLNPEKYDHDTTGLTKYLNACRDHGVTPIRYFIKHLMHDAMGLGYHGLGPAEMKALAVPLENNTTIERLDIEGNSIGEEGTQHLCRVLKENVYIVHLNIGENRLGDNGVRYVLDLLHENRTIEWLDLTGNNLSDRTAEHLSQVLRTNSTLRTLKLRHNELGDCGAQWIKEALMENESLESVDVSWNHFQTKGCIMIAEGIKENVFLKEINISMNGFGLEGALALGEAIKVNRTLLRLDASYCRLPLEGAGPLGAGLQLNETLQMINLGYNSLGHEGAMTLLQGLEKADCSSVTLLDLGNLRVSADFKKLQDKLQSERPLRIRHAGVMLESQHKEVEVEVDPWEAFKRDPMTKLKEWVEQAGYRLIDLLRRFDKNGSLSISREEFVHGIKGTHIQITDEQIAILLDRLDVDGDGEIDFGELIRGDNDHRARKRSIIKIEMEKKQTHDAETETEPKLFGKPRS